MKGLFGIVFLLLSIYAHAQINFEGQLGGSNYLGVTAKTEPILNLNQAATHRLGLFLGVGASFHQSSLIFQAGFHYYYKNWGIGSEISGFSKSPFYPNSPEPDLAFIVYPNLNYSFRFKKDSYLKISIGVLLAFDQLSNTYSSNGPQFAGDPIPGVGLSYGIHYPKK